MIRCNPRVLLATAALVVLVACARNEDASMASADMAAEAPAVAPAVAPIEPAAAGGAEHKAVQGPGVAPDQVASSVVGHTDPKRRFVRTAHASFQVQDVYAATLAIEDAVAADGGFVEKNEISTETLGLRERAIGEGKRLQLSETATRGELVLRVPSERTQAFLRTVAKHMQFLDKRSFAASDVQFDLLRRQLAYARAQELQRAIGDAGAQPGRTGDKVDAVHAREQMLAARDEAVVSQRELEDRIAFSTLTFTLSQPAQVREQVVPDTEAILRARGPGFFSRIGEAIRIGWRGLLDVLVVAVHLWPLWLLVALAAAGWRMLRRRRAHVPAAPTANHAAAPADR